MYYENLQRIIEAYEEKYKKIIHEAYIFAYEAHKGVIRKSGDEYITHPVTVACILAEMHADVDTIIAGLLHDTIEDVDYVTKDLLESKFGPTVASLVDGVTKMRKVDFGNDKFITSQESTRKITESLAKDIRILIIKLADRLHNMMTLEWHKEEKQKEIAKETLEFFVPFATLIGEYNFKKQLEDLCLKYLCPNEYNNLNALLEYEYNDKTRKKIKNELEYEIEKILYDNNITSYKEDTIKKNAYGLYYRLRAENDIDKIFDIHTIELQLDNVEQCYWLKDRIGELKEINGRKVEIIDSKEKDYIMHKKANLYSAIHLAIKINVDGKEMLFQIQITTKEMHLINEYGITAYWSTMSLSNPVEKMQQDVRSFSFFKLLEELINNDLPTMELNKLVREEVLSSDIYVKTPMGDEIQLSSGATAIDFAYKIHSDLGNYIIAAIVNGQRVPFDHKLKDGDTVEIIHNKNLIGPRLDLSQYEMNDYSKRKYKEYKRKRHS